MGRDKVHLSLFVVIPMILVLFALGLPWIVITILSKTIGPYLNSGMPVPTAETEKAFRWIGLSLGIGGVTALVAGVLITYAITRPIRRFIHAFEDITLGKSTGRLRSEVSGEFAQLSDNFNRMLSSLKGRQAVRQAERLAALGALAAGVAHEIRNPLGSIRGLAQLLSEDDTDSRRKKYADAIVAQTERLNGALDTLLHLARPTHSEMKRENLNEILHRASEMLDFELGHKEIELRRQFQGDLPGMVVDGEAMLQAFFNILLNAVQASPKGAVISIQTESQPEGLVRILIRNTGSMIPAGDRERIFDPFFTTKEGGTGLGLAITHQVITAHGGTVEVASGNDGTTFTIELPVK